VKRLLFALVIGAPACFNPAYHDPMCGPGGACPSGYTCVDQTCRMMPSSDDDAMNPDDDSMMSMVDAGSCLGEGVWGLCIGAAPPTADVVLTGIMDTATSTLCEPTARMAPGQPDACVVIGGTITLNGGLTPRGPRPLVLYATTTITIPVAASIDAAGHRAAQGTPGPGAPSASCAAFAATPGSSATGAGGGGGASFMTKGGDGGVGGNAAVHGAAAAADTVSPTLLRAGCTGQKGGAGTVANGGGDGGYGGGAVFLLAGTSITIDGVINVSGGGGFPGTAVGGGGGGGGGGMISLAAPSITGSGRLLANGGGGSGGGGSTPGGAGNDPGTVSITIPATGGQGGTGNMCGQISDGGSGFAGTTEATAGANAASLQSCGGGGGGGGGGYIRANIAPPMIASSPAISVDI